MLASACATPTNGPDYPPYFCLVFFDNNNNSGGIGNISNFILTPLRYAIEGTREYLGRGFAEACPRIAIYSDDPADLLCLDVRKPDGRRVGPNQSRSR
ncbi:hypothetical protein DHEL01_v212261 [Diaporthe helianthi]|uniref:Uncharacterized protein n=1 Tax=Diaporthe helianthi TaxID=158607 RepID=A0A2P5HGH3_DIAHE|nr:hypothetical protein DHEL01_v212261 [Diaporthe helianthi]